MCLCVKPIDNEIVHAPQVYPISECCNLLKVATHLGSCLTQMDVLLLIVYHNDILFRAVHKIVSVLCIHQSPPEIVHYL